MFNFGIAAFFLLPKFIGWKAENGQAVAKFFIQLLQTFILWRIAAIGSRIDQQHFFTF